MKLVEINFHRVESCASMLLNFHQHMWQQRVVWTAVRGCSAPQYNINIWKQAYVSRPLRKITLVQVLVSKSRDMVWCCTSLVKRAFETVLLIHVMTEFFTPFFVESNG
jgi:hypothetical protein